MPQLRQNIEIFHQSRSIFTKAWNGRGNNSGGAQKVQKNVLIKKLSL